jgi:hypothetical protein
MSFPASGFEQVYRNNINDVTTQPHPPHILNSILIAGGSVFGGASQGCLSNFQLELPQV